MGKGSGHGRQQGLETLAPIPTGGADAEPGAKTRLFSAFARPIKHRTYPANCCCMVCKQIVPTAAQPGRVFNIQLGVKTLSGLTVGRICEIIN